MTGIGVSSIFSCFMILVGGLRCSMILVTINVSAKLRSRLYVFMYDFVYLTCYELSIMSVNALFVASVSKI
jgi:hypothetical protein